MVKHAMKLVRLILLQIMYHFNVNGKTIIQSILKLIPYSDAQTLVESHLLIVAVILNAKRAEIAVQISSFVRRLKIIILTKILFLIANIPP
jgi:hypothetical protein